MPSRNTPSPIDQIRVLMGIRNGAAYLPEQLDSIAKQSHSNWMLHCSDDGSTDGTIPLVERFSAQHPGKVVLAHGPQAGFSANFMQMIAGLPKDTGPVAFADQDDLWEPDKLARALAALPQDDALPTLYCARCWYWYPEPDRRVPSAIATRPPSFRNALIENIATGNTIVLNAAAARLAQAAAERTGEVFAHDWWLYLLITGAGGRVVFDAGAPTLLYRQHAGNVIGGGQTAAQQVQRKMKVLQGAFADRLGSNIRALNQVRDLLTQENQTLLDDFAAARTSPLPARLRSLRAVGPYRQTLLGNIGFWGAASLGRI